MDALTRGGFGYGGDRHRLLQGNPYGGHLFPGGFRRGDGEDSHRLQYVMPTSDNEKRALIGLDAAEMSAALIASGIAGKTCPHAGAPTCGTGSMSMARATFGAMSNLAKEFRAAHMAAHFTPGPAWKSSASQISSDGTRKWRLLRTGPGIEFETVYIPEADRGTHVCLQPGWLHADLPLLPYRHPAPGAQSQRQRNCGATARR